MCKQLLAVLSFIVIPWCSPADNYVDTMREELENMPLHGTAFIARVKNNSKWPAGIQFEKINHDAFPSETIVIIQHLASKKYFTLEPGSTVNSFAIRPTMDDPKKAAQFFVLRRMSPNLKDWIGLACIQANGALLRMDKESNLLVVDGKQKDFRDEDHKELHFSIPASIELKDVLTAAALESRLTKGYLFPYKGKRDIKIKEEKVTVDDVWGIKFNFQEIPTVEQDEKGNKDVKYGHRVVITNPEGNRCMRTSRDEGRRELFVTLADANGNDSGQPIIYGQPFSIRFDWGQFLHSYDWDLGPRNFGYHKADDKRYIFQAIGGAVPQRAVQYGELVAMQGVGDRKYIRVEARTSDCLRQDSGGIRNYYGLRSIGPRGEWLVGKFLKYEKLITKSELFTGIHKKAVKFKDDIYQAAVIKPNLAWGVTKDQKLLKWNGKEWKEYTVGFPVSKVFSSPTGEAFIIDALYKIFEILSTKEGTVPVKLPDYYMCKGMDQLAVVNKAEMWGLDREGYVSRYNGAAWDNRKLPDVKGTSITVLPDGTVRATDDKGGIWEYNSEKKQWETLNRPADNAKLIKVSGDFGISDGRKLYRWTNERWQGPLQGEYDDVVVANGFDIRREIKTMDVEAASTVTSDGKPAPLDEQAKLKLEIVRLGMGGGIPGNGGAFGFESMALTKNPIVYGISEEVVPKIDKGMPVIIPAMGGVGGVFLNTAFPNNGSFGFLAYPGDKGGIQIILSDQVSDHYIVKAVIGGWGNQKSAIVKQIYEGDEPKDVVMVEATPDQSLFAQVRGGDPFPCWVSYDNGFFIVGMGEIGQNPFMAWKNPKPSRKPTRVAIASESQAFQCSADFKIDQPVRVHKPTRIYREFTTFDPSPLPLRVADHGSLSFQVMGEGRLNVNFTSIKSQKNEHYRLCIGEGKNEGILLSEWVDGVYQKRAFLSTASYPAIALSKTKSKQFWVSYNYGLFILGLGNIGENPLLFCYDITPVDTITHVQLLPEGVTVDNIKMAPHVVLRIAKKTDAYEKSREGLDIFSGGLIKLVPFRYKFGQDKSSVTLFNDVTGKGPDIIAGVPIPGAFYRFNFAINPDGGYDMEWLDKPTNPTQIKAQRIINRAEAEAEFKRKQGELIAKAGAIDRQDKEADAARLGAAFEQAKEVSGAIAEAGGKLGGAGIAGQVAAGIATGASMAAIATGQVFKGLADDKRLDAAKVEISAQRRGLDQENQAEELKLKANLLKGEMNFAFSGADGEHKFVDKIVDPKIQISQIPDELKQRCLELLALCTKLEQGEDPYPVRLTDAQKALDSIDHYYFVQDRRVRQRIWNIIHKLFTEGKKQPESMQELSHVIFTAYNNPYLIDYLAGNENAWLDNIKMLASQILDTKKELEMNNYFGEYIKLGKLPADGEGLVVLEVLAGHDFLFGFVRAHNRKIRNSGEEIYEFALGAKNNTVHLLRIDSLTGKPVAEINVEEKSELQLDGQSYVKVWFNIHKGHVACGFGEPGKNIALEWQDPYPTPGIRYAMGSCWNSINSIKNPMILPALNLGGGAEKMFATKIGKVRLKFRRHKAGVSKRTRTGSVEDDEVLKAAEEEGKAKDLSEEETTESGEASSEPQALPAPLAQEPSAVQVQEEEQVTKDIPEALAQEAIEVAN